MCWAGLYQSPIGRLVVKSSSRGITEIQFDDSSIITVNSNDHIRDCLQQLTEYFQEHREAFDFPLDPEGTSFQKSVWDHLLNIPYGTTVSYKDIADLLNNPGAIRAVGAANGRNKIAIVIPCHRVIGSDGSLTGYASGLVRKEWLLKHEGHSKYHVNQLNLFK